MSDPSHEPPQGASPRGVSAGTPLARPALPEPHPENKGQGEARAGERHEDPQIIHNYKAVCAVGVLERGEHCLPREFPLSGGHCTA